MNGTLIDLEIRVMTKKLESKSPMTKRDNF